MDKFTKLVKESSEISEDRVKEMMNTLKSSTSVLEDEKKKIENIMNDLESFTSDTDKNDQIDDSYVSLKEVESLLNECVVKVGEIDSRLENYLKEGRKYLY